MLLQVLLASILSRRRREGMPPWRSGLMGRLPVLMLVAYSLMSRYSGFLYQLSHDGMRNDMAVTDG